MNTVQTYTGKSLSEMPEGCEPTKKELGHRIEVLTEVVQALIEHIAEQEKCQLGVLAVSCIPGNQYKIYRQELDYCSSCRSALPMLKHGGEDHDRDSNGAYICYPCSLKK